MSWADEETREIMQDSYKKAQKDRQDVIIKKQKLKQEYIDFAKYLVKSRGLKQEIKIYRFIKANGSTPVYKTFKDMEMHDSFVYEQIVFDYDPKTDEVTNCQRMVYSGKKEDENIINCLKRPDSSIRKSILAKTTLDKSFAPVRYAALTRVNQIVNNIVSGIYSGDLTFFDEPKYRELVARSKDLDWQRDYYENRLIAIAQVMQETKQESKQM